jgi:uncharacterized membrane protein required for colicin V production
MDTVITVVIVLVILFFLIDGIRRGLVRQVFEIVGLVAAFIAAYYLGHFLARRFDASTRISYPIVLFFFSAVVFVAVVIVFHLLGVVMQKIMSITVLGAVDRIGGALFGALKGVLFVSLVCVLIFSIPNGGGFKRKLETNRVAAAVHPVLPWMYNLFMKRSSIRIESTDIVRKRSSRETL